jgi:hypothetical protein
VVVQPVLDPEIQVSPQRLVLPGGRAARLRIRAQAPPGNAGVLELTPVGGAPLRIPWIVFPRRPGGTLLRRASLAQSTFAPSDTSPVVLTVEVGRVSKGTTVQIEPASRLDVLLYSATGTFVGLLTRVHDLLPGSYEFGITGRTPGGSHLPPGRYELRLIAWPTHGGTPSRWRVRFAIQSG